MSSEKPIKTYIVEVPIRGVHKFYVNATSHAKALKAAEHEYTYKVEAGRDRKNPYGFVGGQGIEDGLDFDEAEVRLQYDD